MRISENLANVRSRIAAAARQSKRDPASICLLAVSKTQTPDALIAAYRNRQRHFGENYLQEAIAKQRVLANYHITWHFIGPVQSNKTRTIASRFSWVHSVDRFKIAHRLNQHRPAELGRLNICLQINIDAESSKSGISLEQLPELAAQISELDRIHFRGLMAIPARLDSPDSQTSAFRRMADAFAALKADGHGVDTLSLGMSADLEPAVAAGSTLVRVGTAIFGARCSAKTMGQKKGVA